MNETPFYKDHWVTIDPDRLDRYRRMFEWNPASIVFYEAADIGAGQIVADFGCGPGHTAVEIADWVGPAGHVHALDINASFVEQARENARSAGVGDRVTSYQSDGVELPFADATLDRLTTRNTLIYVDDPLATLQEFHRILRPDGKAHAIEGDWPMMVVEPIATATWQAVVSAASHACRTPDIGRRLSGLMARAGFCDIEVQVLTRPDMDGRLLPMVENLAGYVRDGGGMGDGEIEAVLATVDQALADGTYLALAPQFVVTGSR